MKTKTTRRQKINVITLGCSKNLVDSENLITQLRANQYHVDHDSNDPAEIVIINTCGFIEVAKEESVNTILEYARLREEGQLDRLYVTGCLSQRYRSDLEKEIPEVDAYFGTLELPELLHKLKADYRHELIGERQLTTPAHYAYVKISEGCNRTCAFCAIPLMRGKHRSKPIEALVREVSHLARHGVREVMLIAQELTYYGLDIYKKRKLPELLHQLADIEGIDWIRLHYAYPGKFPLEVIDVMAERPEICNYLDMPLQHASDRMLKAMRRQISRSETEALLDEIRKRNPGICLRTTFMTGFPGETPEDFRILQDFLKQQAFDRVGVFEYSHEEDTFAYQHEDKISPEIKKLRAQILMELQSGISFIKNKEKVGTVEKVLIDRKEGKFFVGRTEHDSPEVDNEVLVPAQGDVRIGDFTMVEITDADVYDLFGKPVSTEAYGS